MRPEHASLVTGPNGSLGRVLAAITDDQWTALPPAPFPAPLQSWLPATGVLTAREREGDTGGLTGALAVETLLPVFAADAWHTGSTGYGLLRMTPGIAAIVAGIGLPMVPSAVRHRLTLPAAFAAAGAAIAAFAMGPRSSWPCSCWPPDR